MSRRILAGGKALPAFLFWLAVALMVVGSPTILLEDAWRRIAALAFGRM